MLRQTMIIRSMLLKLGSTPITVKTPEQLMQNDEWSIGIMVTDNTNEIKVKSLKCNTPWIIRRITPSAITEGR